MKLYLYCPPIRALRTSKLLLSTFAQQSCTLGYCYLDIPLAFVSMCGVSSIFKILFENTDVALHQISKDPNILREIVIQKNPSLNTDKITFFQPAALSPLSEWICSSLLQLSIRNMKWFWVRLHLPVSCLQTVTITSDAGHLTRICIMRV